MQPADRRFCSRYRTLLSSLAGDSISPDGFDLAGFKKNPCVLFSHDSNRSPVATSTPPWVAGGRLMAIAQFPTRGVSAASDEVAEAVRAGRLSCRPIARVVRVRGAVQSGRPPRRRGLGRQVAPGVTIGDAKWLCGFGRTPARRAAHGSYRRGAQACPVGPALKFKCLVIGTTHQRRRSPSAPRRPEQNPAGAPLKEMTMQKACHAVGALKTFLDARSTGRPEAELGELKAAAAAEGAHQRSTARQSSSGGTVVELDRAQRARASARIAFSPTSGAAA